MTVSTPQRRRKVLAAVMAGAAVVLLLPGLAGPAAAHGDDGSMDVLVSRQSGPDTISVEVSIPFSDGDLAEDAIVTATLSGPGSQALPDVPVPRSASASPSYAADTEVPRPGVWLVTFRSTEPVAEATVEVAVKGDAASATSTDSADRDSLLWLVPVVGIAILGLVLVVARRQAGGATPA